MAKATTISQLLALLAGAQTFCVSSNNSLPDKIARNPLRFGMIAGFLGVPVLWMAGDSLVLLLMGLRPLPVEFFWEYEASGALIGVFLGGQGARIWSAWRENKLAEARGIAFVTGALGASLYVVYAALVALNHPFFWSRFAFNLLTLVVQRHLPFLLCLLLIFASLLGPRSR